MIPQERKKQSEHYSHPSFLPGGTLQTMLEEKTQAQLRSVTEFMKEDWNSGEPMWLEFVVKNQRGGSYTKKKDQESA